MSSIVYKNSSINYTDDGSGRVVVLLHGFLENSTMWRPFVEQLSKKNRVITIDLLGHGQSDSLGYVHSMEDNADVVHAVLSELRIRKAVLAGHSMGGYVALAFAELYPEMVRGIALLNSTSRADNDERKKNRDRAIKAVKKDHTTFVKLSIANLFSPDNRDRFETEIEATKTQALQTSLQGIVSSLEGMKIRKDREVLLHLATYPILLVLGEKDAVLDFEENATQAENSTVKFVAFPDGHMSPIENKAELLSLLADFIKPL